MKLRRFIALQFRRPMERGINSPFLAIGETDGGGERVPLVVKSRAGFKNRPEAMLREIFGLLLARELGLFTPEPVLVKIPAGLDLAAADFPEYAGLIRDSVGWNIATVHLGDGWKPWIHGTPPRSIPSGILESAFVFDAMIQNSDREPDNPNLLWRENEMALLDFDKAFAFLKTDEKETQPWRRALVRQNLPRHCLFSHLPKVADRPILGTDLWDAFEEWWLGKPAGRISETIGSDLEDQDLDLPRMEEYLTKLARAAEDFFRCVTEISRR
ncbi:MAG: HipA family kinase [Verrucomicrobiota bacterium]